MTKHLIVLEVFPNLGVSIIKFYCDIQVSHISRGNWETPFLEYGEE